MRDPVCQFPITDPDTLARLEERRLAIGCATYEETLQHLFEERRQHLIEKERAPLLAPTPSAPTPDAPVPVEGSASDAPPADSGAGTGEQ